MSICHLKLKALNFPRLKDYVAGNIMWKVIPLILINAYLGKNF